MTNDKLELLDKQLRQLRKELEDDLLKYKDKGWLSSDFNYWDATVFYQEGSIVKWHDGSIVKAKLDTCGNPDDWYDPQKVDQYGRLMEQKCSCGSRQKSKCVKESGYNSGKMCVKEFKEQAIREWSEDFASKQETLPAEFQQVLADNIWELYEK